MSRNGAGLYSLPAGSTVTNGDTSDAIDINTPLADIATDLNTPRPVVAGGTGASTAAGALVNLGLTATAAELNKMAGLATTAAELGKLAGTPVGLTATELGYVDGVTSAIQTQLDAKAQLASPAFTGQVAVPLGSAAAPSITFTGDTNTGLYSPAADQLAISQGGTQRALFDSNYLRLAAGGIQFNGDTLAANALNDYEQGTWTPTLIGETTAGVATYTTRTGTYTKIGNLVHIFCSLVWTAHTGTGRLKITGLPFTPAIHAMTLAWYQNITVPAGQILGIEINGASELLFAAWQTGATNVQAGPFDAAGSLDVSMTYLV